MLSQSERVMISQVAADFESGNFLIRPRTMEYLKFMEEVSKALATEEKKKTERQQELCDCYNSMFRD